MKTLQSVTSPSTSGMKTTMNTDPIKNVLGDKMPALTPDALGKYRLLSALKNKFGPTFRNHPDAQASIKHFEKEYNYFKTLRSTLSGRGRYGSGGNANG